MLKNYLKIAFRNLFKYKFYSIIDITGLAAGITAFLLITQYVRFEWSYDEFHKNGENIYRVESRFFAGEELVNDMATSSYGYGTAMKDAFPEIMDYARVRLWDNERVINYNGNKFRERVSIADSSFLTMFSFPMLKGDPHKALAEPNSIVITESAARKIFGEEDAIDKTLKIDTQNESYVCKVTGVLKDIPENSHYHFDYLISWTSISSRRPGIDQFWYQHSAYTYILLKPGTDIKSLEEKFFSLSEKYKTRDALKNLRWGIELAQLKDIRLNPQKENEREVKGSRTSTWILLIIAFVIIIIAWINFINMSTARAMNRAKEVGIRKVVGAKRKQLIAQFLFESAIINLCSILASVLMLEIFISYYREQISYPASITFLTDSGFWVMLTFIFFAGVFISGIYPANMLSSIKPAAIIVSGKFKYSSKGILVRKGLVIWQFVTTIFLIIGTIVVYQQIDFMRSRNLGASIDQILIVKAPVSTDHTNDKISVFREELLKINEIKGVTASSSIPGKEVGMSLSNKRADYINSENRLFEMMMTDFDFIESYELRFLSGRNFSKEIPTDINAVIVNEEALKMLEFSDAESAINQEVFLEGSSRRFKIIGVIKNYHHQSLHNNFRPVMIFIAPGYAWINKYYYSIKLSATNLEKTISGIQAKWNDTFNQSSFDYFFLNDYFDLQYKSDQQFEKVFSIFTLLAVLIACLGLFGLAAFAAEQRTKEIGIRKILGATTPVIFIMLSKEFLKWVAIANIIAWPAAYYFMNDWLHGFAYRIEINWWIFMLAGGIALTIALLTISYQALKSAVANPVESLKYE